MQFLADNESLRHTPTFRAWEQYHVDLARVTIEAYRQLYRAAEDRGEDLAVMWSDDRELKRINWGETDLEELRYRLRAWPTNLFPQTPTAKMDRVLYMYKEGLISPEQARGLLPNPDLAGVLREDQAGQRDANARIDAALAGDRDRAVPSAYSDLELVRITAIRRYQSMSADGASETELDRLRELIALTQELIQTQQPVALPPEQALPGLPPGPAPVPQAMPAAVAPGG
jgi:hypothetical protein